MALDRTFGVADHGQIRPIGASGVNGTVGAMALQFVPSQDFQGSFGILGHIAGVTDVVAPYESIPYRRVTVAGVAADYALVSDLVIPSAIINIPGNELAFGIFTNCTVGTCRVVGWDLNGPSAI